MVMFLPAISYGAVQFRVANTLLAVVPLLGIAGVLGHTLGVFVANIFSPFGPIDLLNTIPSFVMTFVVYYIYKRTKKDSTVIGTCIAYSVVLGVTVGWMLNYYAPELQREPLIGTIAYVALGNSLVSVLVGWPVFKILKRSGVFDAWLGEKKHE